jgi:hypothetical protein
MPNSERQIIPYIPKSGPPAETIFSDTYVELESESVTEKPWGELALPINANEFTYVLYSNQDESQAHHRLFANGLMEWSGPGREEPDLIFSTKKSDGMMADVQQHIASSELNLLPTTNRINIIFMNPDVFGIEKENRERS